MFHCGRPIGYLEFCVVGIWRSSNKYEGSKVWSVFAKIYVVVWFLSTIYMIKGFF